MKRELQQQLFNACPLFYRYRNNDSQAKVLHQLMDLGICCGDGWYSLLLDVSINIEALIEQMKQQANNEASLPAAVWVREKYGELCMYIDNENQHINKLVEQAESRSKVTCEVCGDEGKMRNSGWITCLCDHCQLQYPSGLDIDD